MRQRQGELIKILIPAVGGQGGGVLSEWLTQAFILEGFPVQGVGIPGLSQRGGSTVYYIEAYSRKAEGDEKIMFSQYPIPGDVDVILCQEFLELARTLEQGFGSDKTVIVSSSHRIYSTREKLPLADGIYSSDNIEKLARAFSSRLIAFDALAAAKKSGLGELGVNSILLGALGATGAIPIGEESLRRAIEAAGVAVASNIKGFRIGFNLVKSGESLASDARQKPNWENFINERALKLDRNAENYRRLASRIAADYPPQLREILAEALFRLIDFQNVSYAEKFLADFRDVFTLDGGDFTLSRAFAKNLALWMSYEDGIRVAELKTKPERFRRIREEMRIQDGRILRVTDYLKPDAEEIWGLFPNAVVAPVLRLAESGLFKKFARRRDKITFEQKPVTTSFLGYLRLRSLAKLKFIRPYSYRYRREHEAIAKYKSATLKFARIDYRLGCLAARSGESVKGYGDVRRRTLDAFSRFLNNVLEPLAAVEASRGGGFHLTAEVAEKSLALISESTDGIDKAEKLAAETLHDT